MLEYEGKKIVITGGRGYIGSALAEYFSHFDCELILADKSLPNVWMPSGTTAKVSTAYVDVAVEGHWKQHGLFNNTDYIFHLAATEYTADRPILDDFRVNALSTINLLEVCVEQKKQPKIIYSSSSNIFGVVDNNPVNETQRDNPPAAWSIHKLISEHYLQVFHTTHNIQSVCLRLSNVYGAVPRHDVVTRMVINKVAQIGIDTKTIKVFGNNGCLRDYVCIDDVVNAFLLAGLLPSEVCDGRYFVIGGEENKTIMDVWQMIADAIGDVNIIRDDSINLKPIDMRNFIADSTSFKNETGWEPIICLQEGIPATVGHLKRMRNG